MSPARSFTFSLLALAAPVLAQGGWVQRLPAHSPPARGWHGLAYDTQRNVHVLFGGFGLPNVALGDTWEWDGLDWQQRSPANAPSPRLYHAMAYDISRGCVVLYGGRVGSTSVTLTDTWEFDGVDWAQRFPLLTPPARIGAGMAYSIAWGRVILFSGSDRPGPLIQDTWEWDGSNWAQRSPTHQPPARYACGMASDFVRGGVVVFGGTNLASTLSDSWAFDGVDWTPLPATQSPPPRSSTMLVADPARGMLVQFGGVDGLFSVPTMETWVHDGSDWRRDTRPSALTLRWSAGISYDWTRDRAVHFGGYNSFSVLTPGYLSETWEYDLSGAALWSVTGAGCAGTPSVPELRPAGPQRAILGANYALAVSGGVTGGALFGLGFSDTSWNANPLPLPLASYGMPGCQLHTSLDATQFVSASGGTAQLVLTIPNDPGLVGVRFFTQALVPQPGANALGAVMSNAVASVLGSF